MGWLNFMILSSIDSFNNREPITGANKLITLIKRNYIAEYASSNDRKSSYFSYSYRYLQSHLFSDIMSLGLTLLWLQVGKLKV